MLSIERLYGSPSGAVIEKVRAPEIGAGETVIWERNNVEINAVKVLSPEEKEVLQFTAAGFTDKEIAEELFVTEGVIKNHQWKIHSKIGISGGGSRVKAVIWGINNGIINPFKAADKAAEGFKMGPGANFLPKRKFEIVRAMASGEVDNAEIARSLNIAVQTVKNHKSDMVRITGARNILHLVVLYKIGAIHQRIKSAESVEVLSPREKQVLQFTAAGLTDKEIAKELSVTEKVIKNHQWKIHSKIGISGGDPRIKAVIWGIDNGYIDIVKAVESLDPNLVAKWTKEEREIMKPMIRGETTTYEEISDKLGITKDAVKYRITRMRKSAGARNTVHLVVWYKIAAPYMMEARTQPVEHIKSLFPRKSERSQSKAKRLKPTEILSPRRKEILQFTAAGLTNKEIAGKLFITEHTVKNHKLLISSKIGISGGDVGMKVVIWGINEGHIDIVKAVEGFDIGSVAKLTERDREILEVLISGEMGTSEEVAKELGITPQTVKNHLTKMFLKTGARNRIHLVVLYMEAKRREKEVLSLNDSN